MSTQHIVVRDAVAASIKAHRKLRKMSQRELGRRAGVCERSVNHWERGRGEPSITAFIQIAEVLEVDLNTLAGCKPHQDNPADAADSLQANGGAP